MSIPTYISSVTSCIQCRSFLPDRYFTPLLARPLQRAISFVGEQAGHLAIHLETGPTVLLPFGSARSDRISMSDLSFRPANEFHREAAARMIRKYRCLLVQSSSKLRRVYDCLSMRDRCRGKKEKQEKKRKQTIATRALVFRSVLPGKRSRRDSNIHLLRSVIRRV